MGKLNIGEGQDYGNPGDSIPAKLPDGSLVNAIAATPINNSTVLVAITDDGQPYAFNNPPVLSVPDRELSRSSPPRKPPAIALDYPFKVLVEGTGISVQGFDEDAILANSDGYTAIGLTNTGDGYVAIANSGDTYLFDIDGVQSTKEFNPSSFIEDIVPSISLIGQKLFYLSSYTPDLFINSSTNDGTFNVWTNAALATDFISFFPLSFKSFYPSGINLTQMPNGQSFVPDLLFNSYYGNPIGRQVSCAINTTNTELGWYILTGIDNEQRGTFSNSFTQSVSSTPSQNNIGISQTWNTEQPYLIIESGNDPTPSLTTYTMIQSGEGTGDITVNFTDLSLGEGSNLESRYSTSSYNATGEITPLSNNYYKSFSYESIGDHTVTTKGYTIDANYDTWRWWDTISNHTKTETGQFKQQEITHLYLSEWLTINEVTITDKSFTIECSFSSVSLANGTSGNSSSDEDWPTYVGWNTTTTNVTCTVTEQVNVDNIVIGSIVINNSTFDIGTYVNGVYSPSLNGIIKTDSALNIVDYLFCLGYSKSDYTKLVSSRTQTKGFNQVKEERNNSTISDYVTYLDATNNFVYRNQSIIKSSYNCDIYEKTESGYIYKTGSITLVFDNNVVTHGEERKDYTALVINETPIEVNSIPYFPYMESSATGDICFVPNSDYTMVVWSLLKTYKNQVNCYEQDGKMRIAIAKTVTADNIDGEDEWFADIYEFDTVNKKFIRIGNESGSLSEINGDQYDFISYHPV